VVREKEYWLSPMADYLAGRFLPFLSSGKRIAGTRGGKKTKLVKNAEAGDLERKKEGRRGIRHVGPDRLQDTSIVGCYLRFVSYGVHRSIAGFSSGLS
jgi:hypothetical protein